MQTPGILHPCSRCGLDNRSRLDGSSYHLHRGHGHPGIDVYGFGPQPVRGGTDRHSCVGGAVLLPASERQSGHTGFRAGPLKISRARGDRTTHKSDVSTQPSRPMIDSIECRNEKSDIFQAVVGERQRSEPHPSPSWTVTSRTSPSPSGRPRPRGGEQAPLIRAWETAPEGTLEDGLLSMDEENALAKYADYFSLDQHELDRNGVQTALVQAR